MGRALQVMDELELRPGDVLPGTPYTIVALIGAGGMGVVYEVEHGQLGRRLVLKVLRGSLASSRGHGLRMQNEMRALGSLAHPNVVGVTDAGFTKAGRPFVVMERLSGRTLDARLRQDGPLPPLEAVRIAVGVLDGLHAAHGIGTVARFSAADGTSSGATRVRRQPIEGTSACSTTS